MKKNKNIRMAVFSDFYCTECGKKGIPILRKIGQERESGHLKKIFCLYCQKDCNMVEIKPNSSYTLEDFEKEFNGHNFENGNRIKPYKVFLHEYDESKHNLNKEE